MALRRRCISFAVSTSSPTLPPLVIVANLNGNWIYLPDAAIGIHQKAILCAGELFSPSVVDCKGILQYYYYCSILSFTCSCCLYRTSWHANLCDIHKEWNIGSSLLFTVQNKLVCKRIETIRGALLHGIIIIAGCPVIALFANGESAPCIFIPPPSTKTTKTTATG